MTKALGIRGRVAPLENPGFNMKILTLAQMKRIEKFYLKYLPGPVKT